MAQPTVVTKRMTGGSEVLAARAVTSTIPIVMMFGGDPVGAGLAKSLARPGGNVTGLQTLGGALQLTVVWTDIVGMQQGSRDASPGCCHSSVHHEARLSTGANRSA